MCGVMVCVSVPSLVRWIDGDSYGAACWFRLSSFCVFVAIGGSVAVASAETSIAMYVRSLSFKLFTLGLFDTGCINVSSVCQHVHSEGAG